jgi:hypothetical protein
MEMYFLSKNVQVRMGTSLKSSNSKQWLMSMTLWEDYFLMISV